MSHFVLYEIFSGRITRAGYSPDPENDQITDVGEAVLLTDGPIDPAMSYVAAGGIASIPPRPGMWHDFNYSAGAWIDARTAADHQAALYAARDAAVLDKSDLLIRMVMAAMLPAEDAEIAAAGIIPPTIQAALDTLPPEVFPPEAQMIARIKWRSDTVISRVNPVIVLAAAALGITENQMDAIFDVRIPEGL